MISTKAKEYYKNGYSCSESIIQACIEEGICSTELLPCATAFSAGMSSGCACGAVTASVMVIGYLFGRENKLGNEPTARQKTSHFIDEFKKRNKVTCCKVLSSGLEGMTKKEHCAKLVQDAGEILDEIIKVKV